MLSETYAKKILASRVKKLQLALLFSQLTDADGSQTFAFATALPARAYLIGAGIRVIAAFTDGVAGTFTADVGINGGDIDAFLDGASLAAIANVGDPVGVRPSGMVGAVTPALTVLGSVNVNTATAGSLVAEVMYLDGSKVF